MIQLKSHIIRIEIWRQSPRELCIGKITKEYWYIMTLIKNPLRIQDASILYKCFRKIFNRKLCLTIFPSGTSFSVPYKHTVDSVLSLTALYVWHNFSANTHWRKPVPSRKTMNIRLRPRYIENGHVLKMEVLSLSKFLR